MESGKKIKPMVMEFIIIIKQEQSTKGTGKTICSMGQEFRPTQMEINMKECSSKEREMARAYII
jgi:hypothetical protein